MMTSKTAAATLAAALVAMTGVLTATPSRAQAPYPAPGKNITLVLPFAPAVASRAPPEVLREFHVHCLLLTSL